VVFSEKCLPNFFTLPAKRLGGSAIEPSASLTGRFGAGDRQLNNADAPPQPRYRGLPLPKLRFERVKQTALRESEVGGVQREVSS
jgi:hypothetical protein